MSKITGIISAAIGLALVKRFTDSIEDVKQAAPIIPKQEGFTLGPAAGSMDIAPLFPTGKITIGLPGLGGGTTIPGGARSGGPSKPVGADVVIPFFPKGAGDPSLLKPVAGLAGLAGLPKFGDISKLNFQTGLFDPAVQARLRAKK